MVGLREALGLSQLSESSLFLFTQFSKATIPIIIEHGSSEAVHQQRL